MSLLFETIKVSGGKLHNIGLHNNRMNEARRKLYGITAPIDLEKAVAVPGYLGANVHKCRVTYSAQIESIEFLPYSFRPIKTLQTVEGGDIEYEYKYSDRRCIDNLFGSVASDDILIVKKGLVTDTSRANILFSDGGRWLTPADPLLRGTQRGKLIRDGRVVEEEIGIKEIGFFKKAALINAMTDDEPFAVIEIENINVNMIGK